MGEWRNVRLSEIALPTMGQSPSGDSVNEDGTGIPFLQGNADFGERYPNESCWCVKPKKLSQSSDLLVSVRAPVGQINIADKIYCVGRGLAAISFTGIDASFGAYAFRNEVNQLHIRSQGTTFLAVSKADIDEMRLSIPKDEKEQRKIAEVLSTVDTAIEKTRALIEKYKKIKAGFMQDLLTNGIDKHGKIRSPQTHEYMDSPLGRIPMEWECVEFGSACSCITKLAGFEYSKYFNSYNDGGEIIVVRGTNITNNSMDLADVKNIPRRTSQMLPRSQLHIGDLVFAYVGTIGPVWLIDEDNKYHLGPNTAKITLLDTIDVQYIYQYFKSYRISKEIILQTSVGAQPSLSMSKIRKFRIAKPKLKSEQIFISDKLNAIDSKIQSEQDYLTKLLNIKQGLMQDLLTHKVPVDALL